MRKVRPQIARSSVQAVCLVLFALVLALAPAGRVEAAPDDETYPTLSVGRDTYTNVLVLNKTPVDIFIRHSRGMANIKVKEIDPATQQRLGYVVEQPKPSVIQKVMEASEITRFESDPRVQEAEAQVAEKLAEALQTLDPRIYYAAVGGLIAFYLLFSFLCRCLCVKAGSTPSALIWLPLLKQIPLFKAAGMSPAWILSNLFFPLFLIVYVIWCFKIVKARQKNAFVAVLLLLPLINIVAFLYLALSGSGPQASAADKRLISLQGAPRREAA